MGSNPTVNCQLKALKRFLQFANLPVIDLRSAPEFNSGHLTGASHFYIQELNDRLFELPQKNVPLRLIGSQQSLQSAYQQLTQKGYQVAACLQWDLSLCEHLIQQNLLVKGSHSVTLWSPAPLVELFQQRFAKLSTGNQGLDIACGSGRDSIYLARNGWQMTAIDYSAKAINNLKKLSTSHQVEVNSFCLDFEKNLTAFELMQEKYHLILVNRYLYRPLLPIIKSKLAAGGLLVYQTFLKGSEKFRGPKKARFLLRPGELANTFNDMDILLDRVEILADGRPTNIFIAQK